MKKVLIVDDDVQVRQMLCQLFEDNGFDTISATEGGEGIYLYREFKPDVVVLDLIMPGKEGIETIIGLKREFPDVKIIAISGGGKVGHSFMKETKTLGAEYFFSKPFDNDELVEAANSLVDK